MSILSDLIKDSVFNLKQDYGQKITIKRVTESLDIASGDITTSELSQDIEQAIRLPEKKRRVLFEGAWIDVVERKIILDVDDLTFYPEQEDIVLIGTSTLKYKVDMVKEMDFNLGFEIFIEAIEGDD